MNKKTYIIIFLALVLMPVALADLRDGFENTLGFLFDATEDLVYIKAGLWVVLFFLLFKSTERIFPQSRGTAMILSFLFSMLGMRYMPDGYIENIGGTLIGGIMLLTPFFVGSMVGDMLRWRKAGKTFLIIFAYALSGYGLMRWRGMEGEAEDILDSVLIWMSENKILVGVIIGIICVYFLWRMNRGGGGGLSQPPPQQPVERPRFWSGIGRGARGAGQMTQKGGGWLAQKMAQRRARLQRRASLKAGWARAEQKYREKARSMPGGKARAKGTPGYKEWMQARARLKKAKERQGKEY